MPTRGLPKRTCGSCFWFNHTHAQFCDQCGARYPLKRPQPLVQPSKRGPVQTTLWADTLRTTYFGATSRGLPAAGNGMQTARTQAPPSHVDVPSSGTAPAPGAEAPATVSGAGPTMQTPHQTHAQPESAPTAAQLEQLELRALQAHTSKLRKQWRDTVANLGEHSPQAAAAKADLDESLRRTEEAKGVDQKICALTQQIQAQKKQVSRCTSSLEKGKLDIEHMEQALHERRELLAQQSADLQRVREELESMQAKLDLLKASEAPPAPSSETTQATALAEAVKQAIATSHGGAAGSEALAILQSAIALLAAAPTAAAQAPPMPTHGEGTATPQARAAAPTQLEEPTQAVLVLDTQTPTVSGSQTDTGDCDMLVDPGTPRGRPAAIDGSLKRPRSATSTGTRRRVNKSYPPLTPLGPSS